MLETLILDAAPLIAEPFSVLERSAKEFVTTPSVREEIKDANAKRNIELFGDRLVVRQPSQSSIRFASDFARATGDYSVLSSTDVEIIALTYELHVEKIGKSGLRLKPKEIDGFSSINVKSGGRPVESKTLSEFAEEQNEENEADDGWTTAVVKKGKKGRHSKRGAPAVDAGAASDEFVSKVESLSLQEPSVTPQSDSSPASEPTPSQDGYQEETTTHSDFEEDDDGWITEDNLKETILKDGGEVTKTVDENTKVGVSTNDFAMQNVMMQIGLHLVNLTNGMLIKTVKSYMLRCHACFKLTQLPKDGTQRQFCPSCGSPTLMRATVSVDDNGALTVFLKKNMQWTTRGNKYTLPVPQSKASRRHGYQEAQVLLREDEREYEKAVVKEERARRQNQKLLDEWVGGGTVDSLNSPFAIHGYSREAARHTGVKVGRGRYVNSNGKKKRS